MTNKNENSDDQVFGTWNRRSVAKAAIAVGSASTLGALAVPLSGLTEAAERGGSGELFADGIYLVDDNGDRLSEDALDFGERTTVFPETNPDGGDAPTLLVRYEESEYAEPTNLAFTAGSYAAYSKVCTHAGCMVSEKEDGTLVCPCHFAKYDPRKGAEVTGGPAPRALPQLPITISSDGYLIATGKFEGPIGPGGE